MKRLDATGDEWPDATIVQGVVPDVLETIAFNAVAFLHLDMNCALPEEAVLRFFWDKFPPGAVVLLDDCGFFGSDSQREAARAFADAHRSRIPSLPTGQGLLIK